MDTLHRFWNQPSTRYRNFQIIFTLLTLNFLIPSISYAIRPEVVAAGFADLNATLGGLPQAFPEEQSRFWRYLGSANVMTLALMCALLQLDLRRFFPVLLPLMFLKGYNASLFLFGFLADHTYPALLFTFFWDGLAVFLFWFFASRAMADIGGRPPAELVPRPLGTPAP